MGFDILLHPPQNDWRQTPADEERSRRAFAAVGREVGGQHFASLSYGDAVDRLLPRQRQHHGADNVFERRIALEALLAQAYQAGVGIERLHNPGFKHRRRDVEVEKPASPGSFPSGRRAGRHNPEAAFAMDGVVAASAQPAKARTPGDPKTERMVIGRVVAVMPASLPLPERGRQALPEACRGPQRNTRLLQMVEGGVVTQS